MTPARTGLLVTALALAVRLAYLAYNWTCIELEPMWGMMAREGLTAAQGAFGRVELAGDRGILLLYRLVQHVFPTVSHAKIQVIQVFCDAGMAAAAAAIGRRVAGEGAAWAAGLAYALFPPVIFLAAFPGYEVWFAMSLLLGTLQFLRVAEARAGQLPARGAVFALLLAVAGQFRSISILFGIAAAAWLLLAAAVAGRGRVDRLTWLRVATCLVAGMLAVGSNMLLNQLSRGEASAVRGTLGHSLWAGIGQYPNPFGVTDSDAAVAAFYTRETGRVSPSDTDAAYNEWLVHRALRFIREEPGLYAAITLRRSLSIVFPNMPVTLVADNPAFVASPPEAERIAARKALLAQYGYASPHFWGTETRLDPGWMFGFALRMLLLLALPLGHAAALVRAPRTAAFLALLPLAYIVVVLGGYYITPVVIAGTQAAVVPVAAAGWWRLLRRT